MEPFVGEIRLFSFERIPQGWAACDGSLLPVQSNMVLFSLLGIQYGGDGRTNFGLPDLRGRVPVHLSPSIPQGSKGGQESVALTAAQLPPHTHQVNAYSTPGNTAAVASAFPAQSAKLAKATQPAPNIYGPPTAFVTIDPSSVAPSGGTTAQPHENRQPLIALTYCIATTGLYPPRN